MNLLLMAVYLVMSVIVIVAMYCVFAAMAALVQWLWHPRLPVPAAMVLDEMAEQRIPSAGLPCRCIVYLLPDGDSYVRPCRQHSYIRNPDFAAWLSELSSR